MSPSADRVIETFRTATEENQMCPLRRFQTVVLPETGELWITGDIHDHRRNFERFIRAADLASHPDRHIILQELIHGDYFDADGAESSWITLYSAAELKCDYPNQVHFLLSNHDLAQIHGEGIMKAGLSVCEAFNKSIKKHFGRDAVKVDIAIKEFFLSLPLAARTHNGLFCCHSLPANGQIQAFDYTVFDRELTGKDYARRTGPAYQLIWGRDIGPEAAARFADAVKADIVITGHQPQDDGFAVNGPRHLIIGSEHNQGVFLSVDLAGRYDMPRLVQCIRRFSALP